jgi:hypothetical protein
MEPSYKTRKVIGRILLLIMLALLAGSFWSHYTSPLIQHLAAHTDGPIRVAIFTKPAMLFSYTPTTHKARVTVTSQSCSQKEYKNCFKEPVNTFFTPKTQDQQTFWNQLGDNLEQWRFTPKGVWEYVRAYVNALVQKRTNLRPSEFLLLSKELIQLSRTDFAIEYPVTAKKKKHTLKAQDEKVQADAKPEVILPNTDADAKPLVVEVLNASGKKGLALSVTQYLREQNTKGLLRIDVLQYDNYPSVQEKSFIVDYSGKQVQVSQTSQALGIRGEIRSETSTTAICDTRIVLGKDFKMPL